MDFLEYNDDGIKLSDGRLYCRGIPYQPYNEICCGGQLIQRRGYHDACCHGKSYLSDRQLCCSGAILPKTTAGCDVLNACKLSPTRFLTKTQACCGGVLYPISKTKDHHCCHNVKPFKYKSEICCLGTVHARNGNVACCGTHVYNADTQMCCAGDILTKSEQGCPRINGTMVDICKKSPVPRFFPNQGYGCCAGQVCITYTYKL